MRGRSLRSHAGEGPARHPAGTAGHVVEPAGHRRAENGRWKIAHRTATAILSPA
ncbi:hypothetical protein [Nonomuraea solani]|uniref:hypothetical protein n=1 Tax=Nonomuraea solani TaxID=1144553 RepID=UPI001358BB1F|nr:hypothetical protein [Nonomuraea solani]